MGEAVGQGQEVPPPRQLRTTVRLGHSVHISQIGEARHGEALGGSDAKDPSPSLAGHFPVLPALQSLTPQLSPRRTRV